MEAECILSEPNTESKIVNVATVPMRSPFRYPGGKTWLIPRVRQWLRSRPFPCIELIEPFAGGGIVSLTAVFEGLVQKATLVELDNDVASVWTVILNGLGHKLADEIADFELTSESVKSVLNAGHTTAFEQAFATIIKNRVNRGGILAPGAGLVKNGENGKGLASRWYPETLRKRILDIVSIKHRLRFEQGDGIAYMLKNARRRDAVFFIDPPYVVAGRRLYTFSEVDHLRLFEAAKELAGDILITYDDTPEIRSLAEQNGFDIRPVAMKNTHHATKTELLISRSLDWLTE